MIFLLLCLSFLHHSQPPSPQRFFFSFLLCVDLSLTLFFCVYVSQFLNLNLTLSLFHSVYLCHCFYLAIFHCHCLFLSCIIVYLCICVCLSLCFYFFLFLCVCVSLCQSCVFVCVSLHGCPLSLSHHTYSHTQAYRPVPQP